MFISYRSSPRPFHPSVRVSLCRLDFGLIGAAFAYCLEEVTGGRVAPPAFLCVSLCLPAACSLLGLCLCLPLPSPLTCWAPACAGKVRIRLRYCFLVFSEGLIWLCSSFAAVLLLVLYMVYHNACLPPDEKTWRGFTTEAFSGWWLYLKVKVARSSAAAPGARFTGAF